MNEAMEANPYQFDSTLLESPKIFPSTGQITSEFHSSQVVGNRANLGSSNAFSLESLPDSSSSDSSFNSHERKFSSDSSVSFAAPRERDAQSVYSSSGLSGVFMGEPSFETAVDNESCLDRELETSNRVMENHFDFDSAATSPNPHIALEEFFESERSRSKNIPLRPNNDRVSHRTSPSLSGGSKTIRDRSAPFSGTNQYGCQPVTESNPPDKRLHSYVQNALPNRIFDGLRPGGSVCDEKTSLKLDSASISPPPHATVPPAPPMPSSNLQSHPTLYLGPLPPKTRVETQVNVKLTLCPMPPSITQLHIQSHAVSRSRLVAQTIPAKSPHMLELHAMLVCTSAMQDPEKRQRLLARAADARLPSVDQAPLTDEEKKPIHGGPIIPCKICITREQKRSRRKQPKDSDAEFRWQKTEAERSVCFNTAEIKDWQNPTPPLPDEKRLGIEEMNFPSDARQVNLSMRITCYCRHQGETTGFQVIFTLKDHQDNLFRQIVSSSIMITDDHKVNASAPTTQLQVGSFPAGVVVPAHAIGPPASTFNPCASLLQHNHPPTNLSAVQPNTHPQQIMPFGLPQNTNSTSVPKPLSRPASPSGPFGQLHKKRKASIPKKVADELAMTKLNTSTPKRPTNEETHQMTSSGFEGTAGVQFPIAPPYALPTLPNPTAYASNPPTPSATDGGFVPAAQRSQSMDNLQGLNGVYPSPQSVQPSLLSSPTSELWNNGLSQDHAQMLANSLQSVPGVQQPQHYPVINKLTPAEGSKSGGYEVTCLGSGFHRGLEVMFGGAQAVTTTFWGEGALVCLVPPALQAQTVLVTFKQNLMPNSPPQSNNLALFKYIDDEEQRLMKLALTMVNQKWNGNATEPGNAARNIIHLLSKHSSSSGRSNQGHSQQQQHPASSNAEKLAGEDLESAVLSCLNIVDLDDGPFQANYNIQESNGQSMLHLASLLGYYRLTAALLARGAHPDIRDVNGVSPMHLASLHGHSRIIRKLRSAGADPTLRTLNGLIPADMAASRDARDASNAFWPNVRSRSAEVAPAQQLSRASSARSMESLLRSQARASSAIYDSCNDDEPSGDEALIGNFKGQSRTPVKMYARSRRNSMIAKQNDLDADSQNGFVPGASVFAQNPALLALRDHLSAQIHQLQQSLHRTFPALQMPGLPPMPNLPDYQAYPVMRRISSLVPQRNPTPCPADCNKKQASDDGVTKPIKEVDYRWWELLTGPASSPPAYDEIYPENTARDLDDKNLSLMQAAGDHYMDQKCEATFSQAESSSVMETVDIGSCKVTQQQRDRLRNAHALKMKKLSRDRNLFFIWIPLLLLVLGMMLKDRVPKALDFGYQAFHFTRNFVQDRVVEVI
ncbi:SPT3 Dosage dependent suppressor of Ty-induced promoter mutations-like protein [Lecanora helva]